MRHRRRGRGRSRLTASWIEPGWHAHVARHPARRRELPEEPPHTRNVLRNIGVDLGVGASRYTFARTAGPVPGSGQIDDVGAVLPYEAIEVSIEEAEARRGTPVSEEARLMCSGLRGSRRRLSCR